MQTKNPYVIERVNAKLSALERRADHLSRRIKEHSPEDRGRSFDITELQAVEAAITAIRLHRVLLEPETSPVLVLAELLDAMEAEVTLDSFERLNAAQVRGRRVLKELGED